MKEQDPMVCFIIKTRLDKEGFENLYKDLPFQNRIIEKQSDEGGGLAFLWKSNVSIDLVNFSPNHILVTVRKWTALCGT